MPNGGRSLTGWFVDGPTMLAVRAAQVHRYRPVILYSHVLGFRDAIALWAAVRFSRRLTCSVGQGGQRICRVLCDCQIQFTPLHIWLFRVTGVGVNDLSPAFSE